MLSFLASSSTKDNLEPGMMGWGQQEGTNKGQLMAGTCNLQWEGGKERSGTKSTARQSQSCKLSGQRSSSSPWDLAEVGSRLWSAGGSSAARPCGRMDDSDTRCWSLSGRGGNLKHQEASEGVVSKVPC